MEFSLYNTYYVLIIMYLKRKYSKVPVNKYLINNNTVKLIT